MNPAVSDLANLMKLKRQSGEKLALLLGAGASMSSGIKRTPDIKKELVERFGGGIPGTDLDDRFDQLWKETSDANRELFLKPYLTATPSAGYAQLAQLIKDGCFDLALSFNFDTLLEDSLNAIGFTDYKVIIRGETNEDEMQKLVDTKEPRFKLVKLHGSFRSSQHFLFDDGEMHRYPAPIESLVANITKRDIIICGYAFNDLCVARAFSDAGGSIFCVDPAGIPKDLRVYMKNRRSAGRHIAAMFDDFCAELSTALEDTPAETVEETPVSNPFKFLESYEAAENGAMLGRDEETDDFVRYLERNSPPQVIIIAGPSKVGKTSLVRSRLLPRLDAAKYDRYYCRCQAKLEESLPRDLARITGEPPLPSLPEMLKRLATSAGERRAVLVLDQFDRVTAPFQFRTNQGIQPLRALLRDQLLAGLSPNMTLVLVVTDDGQLGGTLVQECDRQGVEAKVLICKALDSQVVGEIIRSLAAKGGVEFDPRIIDEIVLKYENSNGMDRNVAPERRFTLAHIQAICHILAHTRRVDYTDYQVAFKDNLDALHRAINVADIISFVDDFSWPDNVWLRNMIKVPLKESRDRIAEFIQLHYEELLPKREGRSSGGLRRPQR